MLFPENRFLAWSALVVLPTTALAGLLPEVAGPLLGLLALFAAAAVADACLAFPRLRGLSAEFPAVVRGGTGVELRLEFVLRNEGGKGRGHGCGQSGLRLLALELPPEVDSELSVLPLELNPGQDRHLVSWPCRPKERGEHLLSAYRLGARSPFGWWTVRRRVILPEPVVFRVYPNLFQERKSLAAILLNRDPLGAHARRQVGQGREFEKLRDYVHGDGFENIHWKATARRGRPIVKTYRVERTQEIYAVIDASRLSGRPVPAHEGEDARRGDTYLERFISASLALNLAVEKQGDHFGLMVFDDKVGRLVRAGGGVGARQACREALHAVFPRDVSPHFDEAAATIRSRLRRRSLLVFFTSLDDPLLAEEFVAATEWIRRSHLVVVQTLATPSLQPVFAEEKTEEPLSDAALPGKLAGHLRWQQLAQTRLILRQRGIELLSSPASSLAPDLVRHYLQVKQRQAL